MNVVPPVGGGRWRRRKRRRSGLRRRREGVGRLPLRKGAGSFKGQRWPQRSRGTVEVHGASNGVAARGHRARGRVIGVSVLGRRGVGSIDIHEMFRCTEGIGPILAMEIRKLAEVCRNSVEPFVEYHMKLCGHPPGVWIENEGYATSMFR